MLQIFINHLACDEQQKCTVSDRGTLNEVKAGFSH